MTRQTFATLALIAYVFVVSSCNVVNIKRGRIENNLRRNGMTLHAVEIAEAKVSYWVGGKGPAVLLLHGFGASAIWQWHEQAEALLDEYRVVVPDLLWFGGSSSELQDYSIERQARVMAALMSRLNEPKTHVVGISYGGLVAYELATAFPERVNKVVIADSPGRVYTRNDYRAVCARFDVGDLADVLIPKSTDDVKRLMELAYFDAPFTPRFVLDDVLNGLYANYKEEQARLLKAAVEKMDDIRAAPDLYSKKTLILWGREDPVFPLEIGERLAKYLGDEATLVVMDQARHAPNVEHPEAFNEALLKFLAD